MRGPVATMVRVHLRTGWLAVLVWVVGIIGTVTATVTAISGLYDTPEKVHTYAEAVRGDALMMINGRVAGLDSLGGIIANEFGFLASFAIPFLAVSLVARMSRRDEELGRLEAVLAGRIGRATPLLAAVLVVSGAEAVTGAALFASLAGVGVPLADALLYATSMACLGLTFVGIAALTAQLVAHARGVYAIGLGVIIGAYLLRGLGDVRWSALAWLSPLGWQERTRAFGDQQWWPLLIPLVAFVLLAGTALRIASRRDVGSALLGAGTADPRASRFLLTPPGIALRAHRGSLVGWTAATVVVAATFGSVAQPLVDAIEGNPSLSSAMGAAGTTGLDSVLAMTALILALLGAGYAVQAVGVLRAEETSGRLEARLSGSRSRWSWVSVHLAVVGAGIIAVAVAGGAALAASTSWSIGYDVSGLVARAVLDFLPAVLFFGGLAFVAFAVRPRWSPLVWVAYAAGAVIAYLGDPLGLSEPVRALSPFHLIGSPPVEPVDTVDVVLLSVLTLACVGVGYAGFRRRGIPAG